MIYNLHDPKIQFCKFSPKRFIRIAYGHQAMPSTKPLLNEL
jgi:hypothetical protein